MKPRPTTSRLPPGPSRRAVLGVTVAGAAGLLTGCSSGSAKASSSSDTPDSAGGGSGLVKTSEVPVGEGVILTDQQIVVTQPTAGDFKAFSAVCTHTGCTLSSIRDAVIVCPCHGSTFSVKDGSVTGGPAQRALTSIAVKVDGDEVVTA